MPRISDWEPAAHTPCFRVLHACGAAKAGPSFRPLSWSRSSPIAGLPRLLASHSSSHRRHESRHWFGRPALVPDGTPLATASSPIASASASTAAPQGLRRPGFGHPAHTAPRARGRSHGPSAVACEAQRDCFRARLRAARECRGRTCRGPGERGALQADRQARWHRPRARERGPW